MHKQERPLEGQQLQQEETVQQVETENVRQANIQTESAPGVITAAVQATCGVEVEPVGESGVVEVVAVTPTVMLQDIPQNITQAGRHSGDVAAATASIQPMSASTVQGATAHTQESSTVQTQMVNQEIQTDPVVRVHTETNSDDPEIAVKDEHRTSAKRARYVFVN